MIITFLAVTTTTVTVMPFLPTVLRCYGRHFLFAFFFSAPEGAASVLSNSGVALRSSGLDSCLWKDHAPENDASVKCFDDVLG